jgi:ATP synthase delta (OSCP) subunit
MVPFREGQHLCPSHPGKPLSGRGRQAFDTDGSGCIGYTTSADITVKPASSHCRNPKQTNEMVSQFRLRLRENLTIEMTYAVKPLVLGGIRTQTGSTVWDGTVRGQLDGLLSDLSDVDPWRPRREEVDSLQHWEDDGGALGTETPPNSLPFACIDNTSNRPSP